MQRPALIGSTPEFSDYLSDSWIQTPGFFKEVPKKQAVAPVAYFPSASSSSSQLSSSLYSAASPADYMEFFSSRMSDFPILPKRTNLAHESSNGIEAGSKSRKPALVASSVPPVAKAVPVPTAVPEALLPYNHQQHQFGLGVGKYGNEIPSPLDGEIQHTILEMQQELAYIDTLSVASNLRHSKRLLKERCAKLEGAIDPDWVEVDINKPIKVTKRILIPTFRHPNFNYVGRILGPKGSIMQNIKKKFKCLVSVMGAGSTKDRNKEIELLKSNDPRFAHYASPLHIRIDTVAPAHIAHMRMAACLNIFSKLLTPGNVHIEGITPDENKPKAEEKPDVQMMMKVKKEIEECDDDVILVEDFKYEEENEALYQKNEIGAKTGGGANSDEKSIGGGPIRGGSSSLRGASMSARGGRGGGFVPKARAKKNGMPY